MSATPEDQMKRLENQFKMAIRRLTEMQTIFVESVEGVHTYAIELEETVLAQKQEIAQLRTALAALQKDLGVTPIVED